MNGKNSEVLMGRVAGPYGVKGWVKVASFTQPLENILRYLPWRLRDAKSGQITQAVDSLEGKVHGKGVVVQFAGVTDRDQAAALKGLEIVIDRSQLPEPDEGSYYWSDLEGMQVVTDDGTTLGRVDHMLDAGATDVMVVCGEGGAKRRHMIPFLRDEIVLQVDLAAGEIRVNWAQDEPGAADGN